MFVMTNKNTPVSQEASADEVAGKQPEGFDATQVAIRLEGISKCYPVFNRPWDRIKQILHPGGKQYFKEFWALRDLNLEIRRGEVVGIIGRNGAGKSTLLEIITGTLTPTSGTCRCEGRVVAFLELGSGFNPDFTGRENIFLNGCLLGLTHREIDERMGSILEFADIGEYVDQPVKTYSTGMFMRLAFAVAIHVDAEILIIDEVLSVGDIFFQAKCLATIKKLMSNGCTVLLVSHSPETIKALCNKAVLLDHGRMEMIGNCESVMDRYMTLSMEDHRAVGAILETKGAENGEEELHSLLQPPFARRITERFGSGLARYTECVLYQNGRETIQVANQQSITVKALLEFNQDCPMPGEAGLVVRTLEGLDLFAVNTFFLDVPFNPQKAGTRLLLEFEMPMELAAGRYSIALGYRTPEQGEYVDKVYHAAIFEVFNFSKKLVPAMFSVNGHVRIRQLGFDERYAYET